MTPPEDFVEGVLRSFLPPLVHVGTGVIVKTDGRRSRQIDVIVYDPRFPVLEVRPGFGQYFVEGVIATVEVKSLLRAQELGEALDNCASVLGLGVELVTGDIGRQAQRIADRQKVAIARGETARPVCCRAAYIRVRVSRLPLCSRPCACR